MPNIQPNHNQQTVNTNSTTNSNALSVANNAQSCDLSPLAKNPCSDKFINVTFKSDTEENTGSICDHHLEDLKNGNCLLKGLMPPSASLFYLTRWLSPEEKREFNNEIHTIVNEECSTETKAQVLHDSNSYTYVCKKHGDLIEALQEGNKAIASEIGVCTIM